MLRHRDKARWMKLSLETKPIGKYKILFKVSVKIFPEMLLKVINSIELINGQVRLQFKIKLKLDK